MARFNLSRLAGGIALSSVLFVKRSHEDFEVSSIATNWESTVVEWFERPEAELITYRWSRLLQVVSSCAEASTISIEMPHQDYEPRREVVLTGEYAEKFFEQVDNPKYDPEMAKLLEEAEKAFPDE